MSGGRSQIEPFASRFAGRRICVTGGAGFIGGHLVEALVSLGADVRVIDDLSSSTIDRIARQVERTPDRVRFVFASILEPRALDEAMDGCEIVFHLAAMGSVPKSLEDPERCMAVNTTGTVRVAESARRAGVGRIVFASSSSVYGVGGSAGDTTGRREDELPQPMSPYAASKLAGEHVVSTWSQSFDVDGVSLRYFNVFGPHQSADSAYAAVIPAFLAALRAGKRPTIFGDGSFSRDFTPIENVVRANLLAGSSETALGGQAVNIGCGERMTIRELFDTLAELTGQTDAAPEFRPARSGDVPHSLADISLARTLLGYTPGVTPREGLASLARSPETDEEHGPDVLFRIA